MNNRRSVQQGVSLVETIITIVILGIALTALSRSLFFSTAHSADPLWYSRAVQVAQSYLDDALALKYQEDSLMGGGAVGTCRVDGPEAGETQRVDFDDLDDYAGLTQVAEWLDASQVNDSGLYQVAISVNCQAPDGTPSNTSKRIQVTVSGPDDLNLVISAFRGDF